MSRLSHCRAALLWGLAGLVLATGGRAGAQTAEAEPNQPCAAAQAVATAEGVFALQGGLGTGDVDFFRVAGPPGSLMAVDLEAAGAGAGTLSDSVLGAFSGDCLTLLAVNDDGGADLDSRLQVRIPADGLLVLAASSFPDFNFQGSPATGTYRLRSQIEPVTGELAGRLVDAATAEPVRGAFLFLTRCIGGSCDSFSGLEAVSDVDGRFRFLSESDFPLTGGLYRLAASHQRYEPFAPEPFEIHGKTDIDLGDLALTPLPTFGSVRGRLVDLASRRPLPGTAAPFAHAFLELCPEGQTFCFFLGGQQADAGGFFHFVGTEHNPLPAGRYRVTAQAEQYEVTPGDQFPLAADEDRNLGDVPVKSIPVRVELVEPCFGIPAEGGRCRFTVRVANGQPTSLFAQGWSMVRGFRLRLEPDATSRFQLTPRAITLLPGSSTVLAFAFDLPAGLPESATICTTFHAAPEGRPLNVLAAHFLFCINRTFAGFELLPEAEARRLLHPGDEPAAGLWPIGGRP